MEEHLDILGHRASDKVTGFKGVITTISFDLYGCIQAIITPTDVGKDTSDSKWFDITRLNIESSVPVMQQPNFKEGYISTGKKGASNKPIPN